MIIFSDVHNHHWIVLCLATKAYQQSQTVLHFESHAYGILQQQYAAFEAAPFEQDLYSSAEHLTHVILHILLYWPYDVKYCKGQS